MGLEGSIVPAKKTHHSLGVHSPQLQQIHIPIFRIPFLFNNTLTLTVDTMGSWQINLESCKMRFWAWFSAMSALQLHERRVSLSADVEALGSFMQPLSWECEAPSSSFSVLTLSSDIRSNQAISIYSIVWQKCLKRSYRWSPWTGPLIRAWL